MAATRPSVLVTVGTDHHPFDRLVGWADAYAATHDVDVIVQYGTSRAPTIAEGRDYLPIAELEARMRAAAAVVTHGGPATIMQVRDLGVLPIVVARDPAHGEHVDGHQMRFAQRLHEIGSVVSVQRDVDLVAALDRALADPAWCRVPVDDDRTGAVVANIGDLIDTLVRTRRMRRR
jgi:UDP-N-acetylglucosamine transferase subunit ALG13